METVHFALRDEIVNINAMTRGGLPNKYSHQFMICKKQPNINPDTPFLLDSKKTKSPKFKLSKLGEWYHEKVSGDYLPLTYVGFIDLQIKIAIDQQVFIDLADNHFFSVWDSSAPMEFFKGKQFGYLLVFKVYEIKKEIEESLLSKRACQHYYYSLDEDQLAELSEPVIPDSKFDTMKQELIQTLKKNGSFIEIHSERNKKS